MDLGDQRRHRQHGQLEESLVVQARVGLLQRIAHRVVLTGEQRVQDTDTGPVVVLETGQVDALGGEALLQTPVLVDLDLAVGEGADVGLLVVARAIDLRAVPPVGLGVGEHRCRLAVDDLLAVHRNGPADLHRVLREPVIGTQRDVDDLVGLAITVEEPVVILELNPRRGDGVDDPGRLERITGHQLAADQARIRIKQFLCVSDRHARRSVAPEACARRTHPRVGQIVEGAVGRTSPLCLFGRLTQVGLRTDVRILEQVLRTKLIAQLGQRMNLHDQRWVLVPLRVAHLALSFLTSCRNGWWSCEIRGGPISAVCAGRSSPACSSPSRCCT